MLASEVFSLSFNDLGMQCHLFVAGVETVEDVLERRKAYF